MNKLIMLLLFSITTNAYALPDCPRDTSKLWDKCFGTINFASGAQYVGEWKEGNRHGQGTYTYADGDKYVGEWKEGKQNGQGTLTRNGGQYVGEWKDNNFHGQGTLTLPDGSKYVGEFKDTYKHGQGTFTYVNGAQYIGEWKDDKSHGQGTLTYPDGSKYVGEWKDDNFHGQGTSTYSSGAQYVGEWKEGKQNGQGTLTRNGAQYIGEWKDDKRHGQGTNTYADGAQYVGEWKDGNYHGQGTFTYPDGGQLAGYYLDNKYIPSVCKDMGLVKGSSEFGQCVITLINKATGDEINAGSTENKANKNQSAGENQSAVVDLECKDTSEVRVFFPLMGNNFGEDWIVAQDILVRINTETLIGELTLIYVNSSYRNPDPYRLFQNVQKVVKTERAYGFNVDENERRKNDMYPIIRINRENPSRSPYMEIIRRDITGTEYGYLNCEILDSSEYSSRLTNYFRLKAKQDKAQQQKNKF